jgi:ribosomal protein S27E
MPQRIVCETCGKVLYYGFELKSLEEIIRSLDGKCPDCGKKLVFDLSKIKITLNDKYK